MPPEVISAIPVVIAAALVQHESRRGWKGQRRKLLASQVFLILSRWRQLRSLFWNHQHKTYDLLANGGSH